MSRPEFANLMGKAPSWVFRLEDPNQSPPTIPTLLEVAEAFDVDLEISFRSFSHLLNRLERMTEESFAVPSFEDEVKTDAFMARTDQEINRIASELRGDRAGINQAQMFPIISGSTASNVVEITAGKKTRVCRARSERRGRSRRYSPKPAATA